MEVRLDRAWRVRLSTELDLPFTATRVWKVLRDFPLMACQDLFHRRLTLLDPEVFRQLQTGTSAGRCRYRILHGMGPFKLARRGRILGWREGRGYGFSDLSLSGPRQGFPHVCFFDLEDSGDGRSRLQFRVNGLWTARRVPRIAARLWLLWSLAKIRICLHNTLLRSVK